MTQHAAQGFIFDMDGTLVDSSAKVELIWRLWCERHEIDLASVMAIQQGVRSEDTIMRIAPHLDIAAECAWIDELEATDCDGIHPVAGAVQLLKQIPDARWTIATSACIRPATARLEHCRIPIPDTMVCAEQVKQGKPDPQIYQLAAQRLGFHPSHCIAFEDAPAGVASAIAAGCRVIQIGGAEKLHADVLLILSDYTSAEITSLGDGYVLRVTGNSSH
jgi:mannitol-1-/sugar-/sorbitol-6-phosphatase